MELRFYDLCCTYAALVNIYTCMKIGHYATNELDVFQIPGEKNLFFSMPFKKNVIETMDSIM